MSPPEISSFCWLRQVKASTEEDPVCIESGNAADGTAPISSGGNAATSPKSPTELYPHDLVAKSCAIWRTASRSFPPTAIPPRRGLINRRAIIVLLAKTEPVLCLSFLLLAA